MASKLGPRIVTDNLVLALDCADAKSYAGEPTTNLLLYPESINSGPIQESWSGTITQNAVTAPDGTMTATKIEATSGYVYERLYINTSYNGVSFGVGDTITYSVWIKMLDGTQTTSNGPYIWNYNSPTYGIVVRDLSGLGPDWKLYKMTYTIQSHQTNFSISYSASNGGVTGTYAIWHPQLEVKSYNTPYVETSRSATDGWVDLFGNSNDGTLVNDVATGTSHYRSGDVILPNSARYLDFDGTDQYVLTNFTPSSDDVKTISVWIYWDAASGGNGFEYIVGMDFSDASNGHVPVSITSSGQFRFRQQSSSLSIDQTIYTDAYVSTGEWTNLVISSDGSAFSFYKNGVKASISSGTNNGKWFSFLSGPIMIGSSDWVSLQNYDYFNGKIANVTIYNKQLTDAEVLENYNSTKSRFL